MRTVNFQGTDALKARSRKPAACLIGGPAYLIGVIAFVTVRANRRNGNEVLQAFSHVSEYRLDRQANIAGAELSVSRWH
jgi:hypothetical protein